jgi:hypothetical protein
LAATLTPDARAVLLENKWALLSVGRPLLTEFSSTLHVAKQKLLPPPGQPIRLAIDPGNMPGAVVGSLIETPQGGRWELYGELIAERVSAITFAGMVKNWLQRNWPDNPVECVEMDPVGWKPTDRDEDVLTADLYARELGMRVKPSAAATWDIGLEVMRQPFSAMVGGTPAILLDSSMAILAEALSSRVCYRETAGHLRS